MKLINKKSLFLTFGVLLSSIIFAQTANRLIYTCKNSKGVIITSDRPIPECVRIEQKLYSPNGTKSQFGPVMTEYEKKLKEQENLELKRQKDEEERIIAERRARSNILLSLYPNKKVYEEKLEQIKVKFHEQIDNLQKEIDELNLEYEEAKKKLEPYNDDLLLVPPEIRDSVDKFKFALNSKEFMLEQLKEEEVKSLEQFKIDLEELEKIWASLK